ncbi:Hsp20/alpha crystallin family protein [Nonomuraea sp. NPDC050691]|uniref:Hsp20/alpha crystallin family protein n=1 Tax=Nonomuraea sp. NPDC050691 TaxID=3155661 RepID=UPI0033D21A29
MLLTSIDPFVQELERQFNRVAQQALSNSGGGALMAMDGLRRQDDVLLRFDLPGIDPDSIEVTVDHGVLTVGARREEDLGDQERVFVRERPMGTFTRRVFLPEHLDTDQIDAGYANGVLTVRIPVVEKARPRKVEIRVGDESGETRAIRA